MPETKTPTIQRYLALDAYRGLIMLMLVSQGFGFGSLKDHPTLGVIARQFEHVAWEGAVFWDMVQPAFMFIVGVAMPFALAIRKQQGASFEDLAKHVAIRAGKLIILSQILICISRGELVFQLINVLSQIAFTYFITFWVLQLRWRWQFVAAIGLLVFHTLLFFIFPGPDGPFSKEGNIGAVIDLAVIGYNYPGYYVTINFVSSTFTTLTGAWAGMLLMSSRSENRKMSIMIESAVVAFLMVFAFWALVPAVKRLWTATFTFYSAGWAILMLLGFYFVVEVLGYRKWTFPLTVMGANSIFIYSVNHALHGWLNDAVGVFTGYYKFLGELAPVAQSCTIVLVLWGLCYWLYRRRIFIKI